MNTHNIILIVLTILFGSSLAWLYLKHDRIERTGGWFANALPFCKLILTAFILINLLSLAAINYSAVVALFQKEHTKDLLITWGLVIGFFVFASFAIIAVSLEEGFDAATMLFVALALICFIAAANALNQMYFSDTSKRSTTFTAKNVKLIITDGSARCSLDKSNMSILRCSAR